MPDVLTDTEKQNAMPAETLVAPDPPAAESDKPDGGKPAGEAPEPQEGEPEGQRPKKGGWIRRIERLESQNDELVRQNAELMKLLAGKPAGEPAQPKDGKPQPANFQTYEDYVEALADWKLEQRMASVDQRVSQSTVEAQYDAKAEESRKLHPDFDEVLAENGNIDIHPDVRRAVLEADNGPEVAYYLASNPEIAESLLSMSLHRAIGKIGAISASLSKPQPPARKPRSAAPAPIEPVGGAPATAHGDPSKMSVAEYRKWRDSQAS